MSLKPFWSYIYITLECLRLCSFQAYPSMPDHCVNSNFDTLENHHARIIEKDRNLIFTISFGSLVLSQFLMRLIFIWKKWISKNVPKFCWLLAWWLFKTTKFHLRQCPTVCATPILTMGLVMGQFPLCNRALLMITIRDHSSITSANRWVGGVAKCWCLLTRWGSGGWPNAYLSNK